VDRIERFHLDAVAPAENRFDGSLFNSRALFRNH